MNNDLKLNMKIISNNSIDMKAESSENVNVDMKVGSKETDPIFRESPAYTITYQDINEWNNKSDFSGNYNDLLNKPIIPNKTSQLTNDSGFINRFVSNLTNYSLTSSFSNVAFSGDYNDLINKPVTPTGAIWGNITGTLSNQTDLQNALNDKQNLIDSNNKLSSDLIDDTDSLNKFVTSSDITAWNNKSDFSGNYNDLTNKPTIPTKTSDLNNDSGFITNSVNDLTNYTLSSSLATVATSGQYSDLTGIPSLATVATSGSYSDLSNKPTIPEIKTTKTTSDTAGYSCTYINNQLTDSGWVDLSNYVNTTYFKVRTGFTPKVRKIGNVVYFTGYIYCKSNVGSNIGKILNAIPSAYRPTAGEMAGGGCRFSLNAPYSIWIENGEVKVAEASTITVQNDYQGYYLGNLGPYPTN